MHIEKKGPQQEDCSLRQMSICTCQHGGIILHTRLDKALEKLQLVSFIIEHTQL